MASGWPFVALAALGVAGMLCRRPCDARLRGLPAGGDSGADGTERHDAQELAPDVAMALIDVALQAGQPIPQALQEAGAVVEGDVGHALAQAGASLLGGASWDDAWQLACAGCRQPMLEALRDELRDSWEHGVPACTRLEGAVERLSVRERMAIERQASKLSVRLLLPMGLCFLPSFVCIGVIPAIASFALQ